MYVKENSFLDRYVGEVVSKKIAEIIADGYYLNISLDSKPRKFFRYYQLLKENLNGGIDDIINVGVIKRIKDFKYDYVIQVIDGFDNNVSEEKVLKGW